jgi:hypothetical protein
MHGTARLAALRTIVFSQLTANGNRKLLMVVAATRPFLCVNPIHGTGVDETLECKRAMQEPRAEQTCSIRGSFHSTPQSQNRRRHKNYMLDSLQQPLQCY